MRLLKYSHNRFDIYLLMLIVSTVFGVYGGIFTAPRIVTILLFPAFSRCISRQNMNFLRPLIYFFVFWGMYMVISLFWSLDSQRGIEEILYFVVHSFYFFEIIVFAREAENPIRTIAISWLVAFLMTSAVAVWEITTDHHLSVANQGSERMFRHGEGDVFLQRYASVTFYNYNNYIVYIGYSLPFIYLLLTNPRDFFEKKRNVIFPIVALLLMGLICLFNASRGGLLFYVLSLGLYFLFSVRQNKSTRRIAIVLLILIFIVLTKYSSSLFATISYRLETKNMFEDGGRYDLWATAFHAFINSYCMGTGAGSLVEAMKSGGSTIVTVPHNMFLEILVQYGIFVSVGIVIMLIKLIRKSFRAIIDVRLPLIIAAVSMIPLFIISSGYTLVPQYWCYFASLITLAFYDRMGCNFPTKE